MAHSDWIVFVDESGDHSLSSIDDNYPVFVLSFCVIRKDEYINKLAKDVKQLKFDYFGHDKIVFHESEIKRKKGAFAKISQDDREMIMARLSQIVAETDFKIFAVIIDKVRHRARYQRPAHPYHLAMKYGLERIYGYLASIRQHLHDTHFIFEARGQKEDLDLELAFRRVCDGDNYTGEVYPFGIIIADKKTNCEGMQIADLTARPIGLSVMRPGQPNRAFEVLSRKMNRYGKKVFP